MKKNIFQFISSKGAFAFILSICLGACQLTTIKNHDNQHIRMGYLLNMTHAVPIIGVESGEFKNLKIQAQDFLSGGYLLNSLMTSNLDIAYLGPGPYLNALHKGVELRVLGLAATGANSLVISKEFLQQNKSTLKPDLFSALQKIAVPQYGNTQDLLAKSLLTSINVESKKQGSNYLLVNSSELETAFYTKSVNAAMVSEPWGTILAKEGHLLITGAGLTEIKNLSHFVLDKDQLQQLDQEMLRINKYPTALLVSREDFYQKHKLELEPFLLEQTKILNFIKSDSQAAIQLIQKHLEQKLKQDLDLDFLMQSLAKVKFAETESIEEQQLEELQAIAKKAKYFF